MTACRYPSKVQYPDEAAALRQLKSYKRTAKDNKKRVNQMHVYACPDADHWHMGHDRFRRTKLAFPASILPVIKSHN